MADRSHLKIVDAHMHLWDLERISYPWLTPPLPVGITGDVSPIARTYLLDDYLADAAGWTVSKIVHVEAGADPAHGLAETRWLQSIADARGYPHGIVAHAVLDHPEVEAHLAEQASCPNVKGIRQIANWHADPAKTYTPRDCLRDEAWRRGYALLARHGLSFDLQIYPGQMKDAAALAAEHPDIPVILNHDGMPAEKDAAGITAWREGMAALAALSHVSVKISGLAMLDWSWTIYSYSPFVRETIELFGVDRCMFGSNFPVDRLFGGFNAHYSAYEALTCDLGPETQAKLFGLNAERIYRLT